MQNITDYIHKTLLENGFNLHSINYKKVAGNTLHSIEYNADETIKGKYSYRMKPLPDLLSVRTNDFNQFITFLQNKYVLNSDAFNFNQYLQSEGLSVERAVLNLPAIMIATALIKPDLHNAQLIVQIASLAQRLHKQEVATASESGD